MPRQKSQPRRRKSHFPVGFKTPLLIDPCGWTLAAPLAIVQGFHNCQRNPEYLEDWQARYSRYDHSWPKSPPPSPHPPQSQKKRPLDEQQQDDSDNDKESSPRDCRHKRPKLANDKDIGEQSSDSSSETCSVSFEQIHPRFSMLSHKKKAATAAATDSLSIPVHHSQVGPDYQVDDLPVAGSLTMNTASLVDTLWDPSRASPEVLLWLSSKPSQNEMLSLEALHQSNYVLEAAKECLPRLEQSERIPFAPEVFYECFICMKPSQKRFGRIADVLGVPVSTVLMKYYKWKSIRPDDYRQTLKIHDQHPVKEATNKPPSWLQPANQTRNHTSSGTIHGQQPSLQQKKPPPVPAAAGWDPKNSLELES